jgi:hypothetical protein
MRKTASLALAAALGAGTALVPNHSAVAATAPQNAAKSNEQGPLQFPPGIQEKKLNQEQNIRSTLKTVTQDALTRDDFVRIIDALAAEDRERMSDYKKQDFKVMDGVVGQIDQDWRRKYGHDFNIKNATNVLASRVVIVEGTVMDAKLAAANFPVPAEMGEQAKLASSEQKAQQGQADQAERKDLQASKGVALVRLPAEGNLPAVTVSMIEEGSGTWRIAVPDSLTSQQIHTQLQDQLTYFGRDMKQWPASEADTYRLVSHHVILALYDVNAPQAGMRNK